jgi:putative sigma-54 modulation protein
MELTIRGKNVKVSDERKKLIESKLGKLNHFLDNATAAVVELTAQHSHKQDERLAVEMTIWVNGTILRAEENDSDLANAIERVHDKMQRQLTRYKERHTNRKGQPTLAQIAASLEPPELETATATLEATVKPVKVKSFPVQPMGADEAIEQLENVGHDFYVFLNVETNLVNVMYRRKDGSYGLLKPELA